MYNVNFLHGRKLKKGDLISKVNTCFKTEFPSFAKKCFPVHDYVKIARFHKPYIGIGDKMCAS